MDTTVDRSGEPLGLRRTLKLRHLILYGIIIIQPTAPMSIYGVVSNGARVSQRRVGLHLSRQGDSPVGWLCGGLVHADGLHAESHHLRHLVQRGGSEYYSQIPYAAWAVAFVLVFTGLNLRGMQTSSCVNALLALGMSIVVVVFIAYAIRYIALVARPVGRQWLLPFYDPTTFAPRLLFHGASIAC